MNKKVGIGLGIALCIGVIATYFTYQQNKQVTLTFALFSDSYWDAPNANSYKIVDDVIARFEKEHKNVNVTYVSGLQKRDYSEWLSQQALQKKLPDVFVVNPNDLSIFSGVGMLENLDSFIEKDKAFKTEAYFTPALQAGVINKKQYALPYESVPTLMYVNKTLLEKEGILVPSNTWTWEDFYNISKQVTKDINKDGNLDQFGFYGYTWENAVASNKGSIFNAEKNMATLDNSNVQEAIEFTRKLERLNKGQTLTSKLFDKGQVAFCPMRFSEYRTYKPYPWRVKKYANFEWECIPMPAGPQGNNVSQLDTLLMGMSKKSAHKDLAWEFLKMLTYDKITQKDIFAYSQGVSVLKDITSSDTVIKYLKEDTPGEGAFKLDFFNDTMEHAMSVHKFNDYDQVMSLADSEIRRFLNTDEDVKATMHALQTKLDVILKK
ncbi:MAG: sugar ABC transporter substrate-binding protein [Longicatena sp.]